MTAWLIAKALPYLLGLMGLFGLYRMGHHAGIVKAHRDTLENLAKRSQSRLEIENAISQDADLVSRARAAGVVRHTEH